MNLNQGFIVIGDSHLRESLNENNPANQHDSLFALEQAIDYAITNRLALVSAGDLFDRNVGDSDLLFKAKQLFSKLHQAGIPFYGIQGNHDKTPRTPWFMHMEGAIHLQPDVPTLIGGYQVCGLDYSPSTAIEQQLQGVVPCDCLILHQAIRQGLGFDDAWNMDMDWVVNTSNVFAGDLHRVEKELWSSDKLVRCVYTLGQYQIKTNEDHQASFLVVLPPDPTTVYIPYRRQPIAARRFLALTIEDEDQFADALASASAFLSTAGEPWEGIELPTALKRPHLAITHYADMPEVLPAFHKLTQDGRLAVLSEKALPSRTGKSDLMFKSASADKAPTLASFNAERKANKPNQQTLINDLLLAQNKKSITDALQAHKLKALSS